MVKEESLCYEINLIITGIFFPASKGLIIPFSASVIMEMPYRLCVQLRWVETCFSFMTAEGALVCVQVKRSRTEDRVTGQLEEMLYLWT